MKQKKLYEQEIDKIQNIKMTLETQVMNVRAKHIIGIWIYFFNDMICAHTLTHINT